MSNQTIMTSLLDYTKLLNQAKTSCVATWDIEFIKTCIDWCIFIETELAILTMEEREHMRQLAHTQSTLDIPTTGTLLDALHVLLYTLLQNVYTSNTLYLYILKNYRFLTIPEKDILIKDLAQLSNKAVVDNILTDMLQELN